MVSETDLFLQELQSTRNDIAHSHKTHEKERERHAATSSRLRIWNVAIFGVAAASAISAPLLESSIAAWIAAASTTVGLIFTAVQLSATPADDAASHNGAAKAYLELRNDYTRLISDVSNASVTTHAHRTRRNQLADRLQAVERLAPPTSNEMYLVAKRSLAEGN